MAERDNSLYKYEAMSNQVLRQDRRFVEKGADTSAEPESLRGKLSVSDMGTRAGRTAPTGSAQRPVAESKPRKQTQHGSRPVKLSDEFEGLVYVPTTTESREVIELIMNWTQEYLEDVPQDTLRSATDAIISTAKDGRLTDSAKRKEIEELVGGSVPSEKFSQLLSLSKRVPDIDEATSNATGGAGNIDDLGVAVTFGDDSDDVQDGDEDDELEVDDDNAVDVPAIEGVDDDEGVETVVAGGSHTKVDTDTISAHDIDAYWLQRQLSSIFTDPHVLLEMTTQVFEILASQTSLGQAENDIMEAFDYDHFELAKKLCINRDKIVWLTRLARAETGNDREDILRSMASSGLQSIIDELKGTSEPGQNGEQKPNSEVDIPQSDLQMDVDEPPSYEPRVVDLDSLVFAEGSHVYTGGRITLPPGSTRDPPTKSYEQYSIPPPARANLANQRLVKISEMPEWTHPAFSETTSLNPIQSTVFPTAFGTDENLLICAPTGAGKTNVALLTMLRTIAQFRDASISSPAEQVELDAFKIIYIAPLKALVQEQVREFGKKLAPFGIQVAELTGDRNLTKKQIASTQVIVTTPEKWDVITRKSSDTSYTNLVRLLIVDEIHLLHDERGPVLESIISRSLIRSTAGVGESPVRIVGLSATLPNYTDVARFIRADPATNGVFYFDASFRPCPLAQKFIGITEKKAIKRYQAMNDACYDKVMEYAGKHQVIIFVHSRKETAKTARFLRDKAAEQGVLQRFLRSDVASREILRSESESVSDADLRDLLPTGFAIHHAGLRRADRSSAEDLFATGQVQVLVSTATLAWGVNLPAHTVIIKGTQVYNPEKGRWTELSPQDVLQMLGRAGRPRFDDSGDGIIITAHSELNYYMSLLNAKLPIESQLMSKMADAVNAEVVLGTVRSREEAVSWLGYTYLYVRMLQSPDVYKVGADDPSVDKLLVRRREDLAHSALTVLHANQLVNYNASTGKVLPTELGRIASHFYISYASMATYHKSLSPYMTPIDLLRVFAKSEEFKYIPVRQEEKLELAKLVERAPIPVKESVDDPTAKIIILLQVYICRLKLEGFALAADLIYVTQSAGRLIRAMFEISLGKKWASLSRLTLDMCKMVEKRMWLSNSPLRQFSQCPPEVIRKMEASQMPWPRYFDLSDPAEVGQAIRVERAGKQVFEMLKQFPRAELSAQFQPVTPSLLRVELNVAPLFEWNYDVHGASESFIVLVEDSDGERILFYDTFVLRQEYATEDHTIEFTVPISNDPLPPNYFVSLISERWIHSEARLVLSFQNLILPSKFPAHTPLYDLEEVRPVDLKDPDYEAAYSNLEKFNKFQTQTFSALYKSDANVFVGAPPGSGKTICAEFSLLRFWDKREDDSQTYAVYISPSQDQVDELLEEWQRRFGGVHGGKKIGKLTGELTSNVQLLDRGGFDLVLATPTQWDVVSRKWTKRRCIQRVGLLIADSLHLLGGLNGSVYEIVVARMRYMAAQLESGLRIVGLSVSLANGKDLGEWIGASSQQAMFNFAPTHLGRPVTIRMQSFGIPHNPSLMIAMARPAFTAIERTLDSNPEQGRALLFVNDRKQCIDTSADIQRLAHGTSRGVSLFRGSSAEQAAKFIGEVQDEELKTSLENGIGLLYPYMEGSDKKIVLALFQARAVRVLVAVRDTCWTAPYADLVLVVGTQLYEGREHRYIDYPISELLQMIGRCRGSGGPSQPGEVEILTNTTKREYYTKFLNEALPIESHLHLSLHDAFIAEISERVIQSPEDCVDWLTYSYFYRRLRLNPSYYGLSKQSDQGVNEYLSELVESTLHDLSEAQLVEYDEEPEDEEAEQITALNGTYIAAYYNISFITMQTFALSLGGKTKLRALLEIVTSAAEFDSSLPIRTHEDIILSKVYSRVPFKLAEPAYGSPRFKAFVLLQAHISRLTLPPELVADQLLVLEKILSLLAACVDVLSGSGHLNALTAMDLSQMVVQAMWEKESPLKQIPYFTPEMIERATTHSVKSVYDFIMIEDDDVRMEILGMDEEDVRVSKIAGFVNKYPNVDVSYELDEYEEIVAGEPVQVTVRLDREADEDEPIDTAVESQFFPLPKTENWWLVVGSVETRQIYGIKRVTIAQPSQAVPVEFVVPSAGKHELTVWCMSDSYVDADKEVAFTVDVADAMEE